ncbi:CPBP family intramembrane glutamic endopeptidase [Desmospora activa]|uniref:CAAX prenyl protease 2/Lysostaphin resistance protein A-like domain-containing protein n=1 Tax=Desmospora activa DSM 45169 TaxID=1121389 RepID=A0A2T4Z9T2_9BACL|nr:type II CAAX endopeptidase family protein [Desmospora activa]PTM58649.1 hypothetical protein C8J48_1234 [Desmospora activa DSM 45169]
MIDQENVPLQEDEQNCMEASSQPRFSQKWLLWNLFLTQVMIGTVAVGLLWMQGRLHWQLFGWGDVSAWLLGVGVGLCIVVVDWALSRFVLPSWVDDGGINQALFHNLPIPVIAVIAFGVAVAEELLFRGALQHWLGVVGTSILFTMIHFRYWRYWGLIIMLFVISSVLGWMVEWSGSLAPAIAAHFTIDFIFGVLIRKGWK